MTIDNFLLVWNILLIGNILSIGNILFIRYILLLSSINFGTEISKRLLLRGPDGHWGSRHYTVRLFIFCGYIFSEYVMDRKNSINQPNAASVTFHLIMQGFWALTASTQLFSRLAHNKYNWTVSTQLLPPSGPWSYHLYQ